MNPFAQLNSRFDQNRLNAFLEQQKAMQAQPPQAKVPKPEEKKNFWLDQISTVGGILGGIGGSFIAPIAGTAGGAAAGSGLGEAIENIISGESATKNVVKEAALGGVFGAGPLKLLKGAGAGVKALATGADDVAGAASRAAMTPLRQQLGNRSLSAADRAITKQFKFSPSQLTNFSKRHGEDPTTLIKRYGINSADDVTVKAIEPLQSAFDDVVTKIPTISSQALSSSLKKVYNPLIKSANLSEQQLGSQLKAQADEIIKKSGQAIPSAQVNTLRKSFDDFVKYTMRGTPEHNVNKMTADALRETLQKAADKAGLGFQGKTFKEIGRDLSKLYDLDEIVGRQANLGRGSNPVNLTNLLGMTAGGAGGGPAGMAAGALLTGAANSSTGRTLARRGAESVGNRLVQSGAKSAARTFTPRGIATRVGGQGVARSLPGQQPQPTSLEDAMFQSSFPNQENQAYMPNAATNSNTVQNISQSSSEMPGLSRENILAAMLIDIQETGGENIGKIQALYEFANPETEQKPLGGEAQKRALTSQSGLRSLDTLEQTLQDDPGAFQRQALPNPLGITARFTGTTDVRAATDNIVDVIARLRSGAAITDDEAKRFARLLPQPGDSAESAARKLQNVRMELESFVNPGPSLSLEDALMQQGGF